MKDLFETPDLIPQEVRNILDTFDNDADPYKECARIEAELKPLGYTFDWGLDGEGSNLRKIDGKTKKQQFDILSPDGISISFDAVYTSKSAAEKAFKKWAKRYEAQGYYSSNGGRIPLAELRDHCQLITL